MYFKDGEIAELIAEEKPISLSAFNDLYQLPKVKGQHKEQEISIPRDEATFFKVIIRCSRQNPFDFSVIVGLGQQNSNQIFKIRRYNGKHQHRNRLEGEVFYGFHIHQATERYQDVGLKEETFATETDKFSDLSGAIKLCITECNIIPPVGSMERLI
jgi:hypothetical protein